MTTKEEKLQKIYELTKAVNELKAEKKDTAAGYRDQIKEVEKNIADLVDEVENPQQES